MRPEIRGIKSVSRDSEKNVLASRDLSLTSEPVGDLVEPPVLKDLPHVVGEVEHQTLDIKRCC